ncbi:hypothetical protein TIFTF001_016332 [Ficus carica]|uniref:Uncharacterized protein n=1 Tax=Ficus carica TaxID=3494 RepID=A0AA88AT84_FICCA|nr:hypothetical protein TIFTF001_016332 [Ficus carica]
MTPSLPLPPLTICIGHPRFGLPNDESACLWRGVHCEEGKVQRLTTKICGNLQCRGTGGGWETSG